MFKMKYQINEHYITSASRPKRKAKGRIFGVAHDTGNKNSTASGNRNWFETAAPKASAHVFIDDREIIITVPIDEVAWHVRYNVQEDNELFGVDANDYAVGVELCYFDDVSKSVAAYDKYVWFFAYLCHAYKWNPRTHIIGHSKLDPGRKTDPENALGRIGISWNTFISDVEKELKACTEQPISDWAIDARNNLKELGITDGTRPKDPVTREEVWTMLDRLRKKV